VFALQPFEYMLWYIDPSGYLQVRPTARHGEESEMRKWISKTAAWANRLESETLSIALVSIFLVAVVIGIVAAVVYAALRFGFGIESGSLGAAGDFFGGTLNPIFSFIALVALLLTINLQSKELAETRKEISASREAQEGQRAAQEQNAAHLLEQIATTKRNEKADITFRMLDRWTNPTMRECRLSSWDYITNILEKTDSNARIKLNDLKNDDNLCFYRITFVCQFLSDLNKFIEKEVIDDDLLFILMNDSVYPWFSLLERLDFGNEAQGASGTEYQSPVESWYRTRVMGLQKWFDAKRSSLANDQR
jgi:uncharacterized membrane protein